MDGDDVTESVRTGIERLTELVQELQDAISNENDTEIQAAADAIARTIEALRAVLGDDTAGTA